MSAWDRVPRYKPSVPPFVEQSPEARLKRPYVATWINSAGYAVPLGCFHLRKAAERRCRDSMRDGATPSENHHTRFYIYDSSYPRWAPDSPHCWTPIAERPRDQWVPTR